jgi:hypothetical protein
MPPKVSPSYPCARRAANPKRVLERNGSLWAYVRSTITVLTGSYLSPGPLTTFSRTSGGVRSRLPLQTWIPKHCSRAAQRHGLEIRRRRAAWETVRAPGETGMRPPPKAPAESPDEPEPKRPPPRPQREK